MSKSVAKFKDFISLQRGFDLPNSQRQNGLYPVVASTSISGYHNAYKVKAPGVVTGRSGSLGDVQYISCDYWPLNTTLWVKDFKGNIPKYIYYFLNTIDFVRFNSGAGVPTLNRNDLDMMDVYIDDLPTQQKIVSLLSAYDNLIENNNRRIAILEEMAQRLYREWFVHFRFPGHENVRMTDSELGEIPEGWVVSDFYKEADILSGGTPSTKKPEYWDNGSISLFSPRDAGQYVYINETGMKITDEGLKKCNSGLYGKDTVIITARGTVGKIVLASKDMAINQSCYALRGKAFGQLFLYHHLKNALNIIQQVANGTAFATIVTDTFKSISCLVPNQRLVDEFEMMVSSIYKSILNLQNRNTNLRKTRDLLIPCLISGRLDVSELNIPTPEEVVS